VVPAPLRRGFDPDSEAIVTIGSKEGLAHLMLATLDQGDTVLVPNPSYPIHIWGAVIAGANIRSVRMTGVDFFDELERAVRELSQTEDDDPRLPVESDRAVRGAGILRARGGAGQAAQHPGGARPGLCRYRFDGWKAPSIMQVPGAREVAVEFFTLSKSYNMAGWRIGFMVGNRELVAALARIKSYHDYGSFTPVQVAAIAALEGDQQCVSEICASTRAAAMCCTRACAKPAGRSTSPRPRCTSGRASRKRIAIWARWSFPSCWPRPRFASPPASASESTATVRALRPDRERGAHPPGPAGSRPCCASPHKSQYI
jgi:hypothetical protein